MQTSHLLVCLRCSLFSAVIIVAPVFAQIRVDANAPADQRPTIHQAGNGVPLVNIQTPSAAGVSHNRYRQFDVGNEGAILNNSRTPVSTQLGGWVDGNPWLATGSARIILNEVNSTDPSHLHGWIEVAGQPAQVVTANPAGITCDGCGFINAHQATLVTGTPTFRPGHLDGYRIHDGQVRIEGLGLDGRQADAVTVLARSVELNAGLWAKRMTMVTGTHEVTVDAQGNPEGIQPVIISPLPERFANSLSGGQAATNTAPVFALDVTHLGGMYAGHIFLIGTEHGLGVRQAGTLNASGQLHLDSQGRLENRGTITAGDMTLHVNGPIENRGVLAAQHTARIETPGTLTNTGDARLYGDRVALQAHTVINAGETAAGVLRTPVIAARRDIAIGVDTLHNRDGALIFSGGDLSVGRQMQTTIDPSTGDTRFTTTGHANHFNNDSATIEVMRDAFVDAIAINNRNIHLTLTEVPEAPFSVQHLQVAGTDAVYLTSQCGRPSVLGSFSGLGFGLRLLCSADGQRHLFEDYTLYNLTGTPSRSAVTRSKPAVFRVGGHLSLNGDGSAASQLINQDSQIIVGGDINLTDTSLNNHETKGTYQVQYSGTAEYTTVETCGSFPNSYHCRHWHGQFAYNPAPDVTTIDLPTGQRYVGNTTQTSGSGTNDPSGSDPSVQIPVLLGTGGASNALFAFTEEPESPGGYLIETDPRFASYRQWVSSDYLLHGLALDQATTQKRLGDGFYEQALVRDQVAQLTGRRWLPGYADGSDVIWVNSEVSAGERIQTESGTDTSLRGGVLSAPQVTAKVGTRGQGDLTIESLQNTSRFESEQQQRGASVSVPIAGASNVSGSVNATDSQINNDYASVVQPSGIRAGDGGFQVSVHGDTTLTGGAITSTQRAIDDHKNRFHTEGALTTTDIENRAVYDARSVGVHIGAGYSPAGKRVPQGTGVGIGREGDAQHSTTQAAISDIAGNKRARTGDAETGLINTFDATKVQEEINAQVQITQQFAQQAGKRISDYSQMQRTGLQAQMKNTNSVDEQRALQQKINEINNQERVLNVLVGAVTGFGGVMVMKESLSLAADQMRQWMIEDSGRFKGVTDGKTVLNNLSGPSDGVRGDGVKVGGTRVDLDLLCGPMNERCRINPDRTLMLDPDGYVVFKDGSLEEFVATPDGKKMIGLTGGVQGKKGELFGYAYAPGSWQDQLVETFSGTHDMIGGKVTGLYDEQGNIKRGMTDTERGFYDAALTTTAIVPSTPFAMAELLSPEVWKAIAIFLGFAQ